MHIPDRATTVALLLAAVMGLATARLLPDSTLALVSSDERAAAEQAFHVALSEAANGYQRSRGLPALQRAHVAELKEAVKETAALMSDKRIVRFRIAALRRRIADAKLSATADFTRSLASQTESGGILLALLLPDLSLQSSSSGAPHLARSIIRRALVTSLGSPAERFLRWQDLREPLFSAIEMARRSQNIKAMEQELSAYERQYADLLLKTDEALRAENDASEKLRNATEQFERIQQTMQEVHAQVLRLQGELARIDAEIRARIEAELIAKGLLTPGTIDHTAISDKPQFAWPAYGRISAGFLAPGYQERFGIPHRGLDIAIGQASPVYSAADGVVFLARDGGQTGYSYVLVGHRAGYATLYGHLSQIAVTAGQDLHQGQLVGLSGGAVGARGSGPTTTGPHLHFEILMNGTNVDPRGLLP
jgi:murein DD-endopeptidase MepM/ murein hydrolase activator NlpD